MENPTTLKVGRDASQKKGQRVLRFGVLLENTEGFSKQKGFCYKKMTKKGKQG
jgi:hypothetical protein